MGRKLVTLDDIERRLTAESRVAYYQWIRQVLTLSSGALTVLVALKNNYVPAQPRQLWLLKLCWMALALSILSALFLLHGEYAIPLFAAKALRNRRLRLGDQAVGEQLSAGKNGIVPPKKYAYALYFLVLSFLTSMVSLSLFAVLNL